jgi:release factor glutamine methyltransferase
MNRTADPASIRQLLEQATSLLPSGTARLDAEVLLAHALGKARSHLHAWPEKLLSTDQQTRFQQLLRARIQGEPVAHLTGQREFWSLMLNVTPATLIPRPETETLVALALQVIPAGKTALIADLGTGSGAIALAIAHERPRCHVLATDISAAAIETATANAQQLGITNIEFHSGDWCEPLAGRQCDVIVSNPPYIKEADPHLQSGDVRFEPQGALVAGQEGMDDLVRIAHCARQHLIAAGWLMMEHGYDQSDQVTQLLETCGFQEVTDHKDDAGLSRVIIGKREI